VKSRTWSRRDAEHKASMTQELVRFLDALPEETETRDYVEIVESAP